MQDFEGYGARPSDMGTRARSFGIGRRLKHFFTRSIYLRRKGFDWQIVLEEPPAVRKVPAPLERPGPEISEMRVQLTELLNRHATSRSVLHHLATLERLIKCRRPPSFDRLPMALLSGAHRQLITLAGAQPSAEIAALQSRLMLALVDRGMVNVDSDMDPLRKMHIEEVSVSVFLEADQQWMANWTGAEPPDTRPTQPPSLDGGRLPA